MIKIFEIDNNGDDQYNFLWSNVNLFAYFIEKEKCTP